MLPSSMHVYMCRHGYMLTHMPVLGELHECGHAESCPNVHKMTQAQMVPEICMQDSQAPCREGLLPLGFL